MNILRPSVALVPRESGKDWAKLPVVWHRLSTAFETETTAYNPLKLTQHDNFSIDEYL